MIIRIRNGKKNTYEYRRDLFSAGFKLVKKKRASSYFEKSISDQESELLSLKYQNMGLKVELIPDSLSRNYKYREDYFSQFVLSDTSKFKCVYCGKWFDKKQITIDHIWPIKKANTSNGKKYILKNKLSGINDTNNLVPCCKRCNSSKGSKTGLWIIRAKWGQSNIYWTIVFIVKIVFFTALLLIGYQSIIYTLANMR